ncbi:uncharacterized protein [Atheta coriaria]|uniref:uncharacterized protein n=1 Tax=Dalotia coriaria TaxID=877792 RepID=UPI0031F341BC
MDTFTSKFSFVEIFLFLRGKEEKMIAFTKWVLLVLVGVQMSLGQDLTDYDLGFDNPLFNIWNGNRNTIVPDTRRPCTVTGASAGNRDGTCLNPAACRFQRGRAEGRGTCSIWNTCCVFEKAANQTTDARVTYFVSTPGSRDLPQAQKMYVRLANRNVCQMRVDIISMNLALPDLDAAGTAQTCTKDYLRVDPNPVSNPIPLICGLNANTHFYVHLDRTHISNNGIILSVNLNTEETTEPSWNIKVTQLECPGTKNLLQHHKDNRNQAVSDFSLLAPARCLQYFTEPSGRFFNFGYTADTTTTMTTNQNYAVCFKAIDGSCGVSLTPSFLNLRPTTDATCIAEAIIIPEGTAKARICGTVDAGTTFISKHPGPLYVHVYSESVVAAITATTPYGFNIEYSNSVACP